MTVGELAQRLRVSEETCREHIEAMRDNDVLEETQTRDGIPQFRALGYHIPVDMPQGFEAALWDHFSAVVRSMCQKIRLERFGAQSGELIGGTTYHFDVPRDSEEYREVTAFLGDTRKKFEALLARAEPYRGAEGNVRITAYAGQLVEDNTI